MTLSQSRKATLLRALAIIADAELDGRSMTARTVAAEMGMAESAGAGIREDLAQLGWLYVSRPGGNGRAWVIAITETGWALIGGRRERPPKARTRRCLRCRKPFASSGPGNRICGTCRKSSDYAEGVRPSDLGCLASLR